MDRELLVISVMTRKENLSLLSTRIFAVCCQRARLMTLHTPKKTARPRDRHKSNNLILIMFFTTRAP